MSRGYTLVTGAAGFIGSRLTQTLLSQGRRVIAVDSFLDELYPASVKMSRWKRLGLLESDSLRMFRFDLFKDNFDEFEEFEITSIFNQAALPGLINKPSVYHLYYDHNLSALNRLLEFAKNRRVKKFVHASTSSVYGKSAIGDESSELYPISPYGVSKLAAEKLLKAYQVTFNIPTVVLRYFSVYGPGQRPDMAYSKLIAAALTGQEFCLFGDGHQKRSNTYIDDVVDASIKAEMQGKVGETFNVSGDETISLLDAIRLVEDILKVRVNLRIAEARVGDQIETSGLNRKIKSELDWTPKTNFMVGIQNQIQYAKETRDGDN